MVTGCWRDDLTFSSRLSLRWPSVNCLWSGDRTEREVGKSNQEGVEGWKEAQNPLKEEGDRHPSGDKALELGTVHVLKVRRQDIF